MRLLPMFLVRLIVLACLPILGCGQPIYEVVAPVASDQTETTEASDAEQYNWPLSKAGYFVEKPPPMAFVSAFTKPIEIVDPVTAELVPWNDEELHTVASALLHDVYDPPEEQLDVKCKIERSQLLGPMTYDVTRDGKGMITVETDKSNRAKLGLYNEIGRAHV